jgi:hypothetical protein
MIGQVPYGYLIKSDPNDSCGYVPPVQAAGTESCVQIGIEYQIIAMEGRAQTDPGP